MIENPLESWVWLYAGASGEVVNRHVEVRNKRLLIAKPDRRMEVMEARMVADRKPPIKRPMRKGPQPNKGRRVW